jgi:hypothetical protein
LTRQRAQFEVYGAPLWTYVTPTRGHRLGAMLAFDPYAALGETAGERVAYLGIVTLALMGYTAVGRVPFPKAGYVWSAFVLLVVLSLGAQWQVGALKVSLPSNWLWRVFAVYRMTRVPARFSLFAAVLAGVLAAAGLKHLLARLPRREFQWGVFAALAAVAVADLSMAPFWNESIPAMPGCYTFLKQHDPKAAIVEIPHLGTGGSNLNAACTYWQSLHRLTTSAGYSGHANVVEDARMGYNSPFLAGRLEQPDYLDDPGKINLDINVDVGFRDYVWLYLTVNRFDYIILHQWPGAVPEHRLHLERLKTLLGAYRVYEDESSIVYARSLIPPPARPVHICLENWRERNLWSGRWNCWIPTTARIVVYNPDAARDLRLILDVAAPWPNMTVRLQAGASELARWEDLTPRRYEHRITAPFRLPSGVQELTIQSSRHPQDLAAKETRAQGSRKPYLLRVARVSFSGFPEAETALARDHTDPPSARSIVR